MLVFIGEDEQVSIKDGSTFEDETPSLDEPVSAVPADFQDVDEQAERRKKVRYVIDLLKERKDWKQVKKDLDKIQTGASTQHGLMEKYFRTHDLPLVDVEECFLEVKTEMLQLINQILQEKYGPGIDTV